MDVFAGEHMMNVWGVLLGAVSLLAGRKFFWLFVGIVGFATGMEFTVLFFEDMALLWRVLVALGVGLFGYLTAVATKKVAILLVGFFGGGYLAFSTLPRFIQVSEPSSFLFVIGGVIGAIVMAFAFDLALVLLSSLFGAALIIASLGGDPSVRIVVFSSLAVAGIFIQFLSSRKRPAPKKQAP